MRIVKPSFYLLILFILGGCAGVRVSQDYEPGTDFAAYKTFDWKSADQPQTGDIRIDNPLLDGRIRKAVELALVSKGFRKTERASADFLLEYSLAVQAKIDSAPVSIGTGFGIGGGGSFGGIGVGTPVVDSYEEGLLIINIYDTKTGQLIWRGSGTRRLGWQSEPAKNTEDVNTLVDKILAQYPPSSKS
ncbi:MAG: DUF4136 domain-containing protein [Desulfobacterales bacterium]